MRSDFQKLLCECYKEGRAWATSSGSIRRRRKQMQRDEETCTATHIPDNKLRISNKSFGENLAPLKRFINKQVGRPWDKVYSEICRHNSKAGAVGLHIFQHLYWYIEVDVKKDDKKHIYRKAGSEHRYGSDEISFGDLFVDPDDNIIKRYRKNKHKKTVAMKQSIRIDALHTMEIENGIWYAYTWKETINEMHHALDNEGDCSYKLVHCMRRNRHVCYPGAKVFATHKRQLNQRELKKHRISNIY